MCSIPPRNVVVLRFVVSRKANAQALYPREKNLKVVTARSPNGMIHYCAVVGEEAVDPKYPKIAAVTKVVLQGDSATDRRTAMMTLLEQTEKKVAKEILKR
jgi:hypothetical protein